MGWEADERQRHSKGIGVQKKKKSVGAVLCKQMHFFSSRITAKVVLKLVQKCRHLEFNFQNQVLNSVIKHLLID